MEAPMRISKPMVAAAGLAVLAGIAAPGAVPPPRTVISLRESLAIGGLDDETLFQWTGLTVDRDGNIYVLDAMDFALKKFDARGRPVARTGRKGQGPGEFTAPRLLDCSDRFLFATDQSLLGVLVFDHDLNFLRRIRTPSLVSHLKALDDDRIAVLGPSLEGNAAIQILDGNGAPVGRLDFMERKAGLLQDAVSFVGDGRGGFILAFLFQDRVERWPNASLRAWTRSFFGGGASPTKAIQGFSVPTETCFKDVAVDGRGFIYVLGGNRARHSGRDVLVLNADGSLFQTITLPDTTHSLYIDRRNSLYVRANDGVTVKRYEIRYE
jgi:hypothetical protein